MAEIALQNITAMTAPRWQTYLRDIVRVAPTVAAVDVFIAATAFNLPDTIVLSMKKGGHKLIRNWQEVTLHFTFLLMPWTFLLLRLLQSSTMILVAT